MCNLNLKLILNLIQTKLHLNHELELFYSLKTNKSF